MSNEMTTEPRINEEQTKPETKKATGEKKGMNKIFKLVYFPVLALLVVLMLAFSIVDAVYGYKPKTHSDEYYKSVNELIETLAESDRSNNTASGSKSAANAILNALKAGGFKERAEVKAGGKDDVESPNDPVTTVTEFTDGANSVVEPIVTLMTANVNAKLMAGKGAPVYVGELTNVVAVIPSKNTVSGENAENSGAVIMTVRYDSREDTYGAGDNAAFVANAVQTLIENAKDFANGETRFENDIVVVFTQDQDYSYGAYAFFDAFKGLNKVVERAKYGLSLDSFGNAGTLAVTDTSGAGHDYLAAVAKTTGSAYNSSVAESSIPNGYKRTGAVDAFGSIPAIQVSVLGGLNDSQSYYDDAENLSQSVVYQQAAFLQKFINKFGNSDKTYGADGDDVAYISYLDWGTVSYNKVAAYVVGGLIVALLATVLVLLGIKKYFSLKKLLTAFGVELLILVSSLAVTVSAYFLIALLLCSFGVIPVHAIVSVRSFNADILIAGMFVTLAAVFGFTSLYKKLFRVTASDIVRGTAVLFGVTGALMCFAAPQYSFVTAWLGLLMLVVLLVTACLNGKLKERFGYGFDRLFVYVIPVLICMPFVISTITVFTELLPLWLLPITMMLFAAMLGVAVPYLDRTVAVFDKIAKKLPPRTLRVERIETQKVEDRAKKGKFTEQQVKVVEKQRIPVNYKNYFGVSTIAVIGVIIAVFSGSFGASFGKSITAPYAYADAVYNNAIVYEWEKNGSGAATHKLVIDDLIAYKYLRYYIDDLEWDGTRYTKPVYGTSGAIGREPDITRDGSVYTVTTCEGSYSSVTLTIPSARNVTKITVKDSHDNEYEYEFNNNDTITLRLPYGFDSEFTLTVEGVDKLSSISYEEHYIGSDNLDNVDDWNETFDFRGTSDGEHLRAATVLKLTKTF